MNIINNGIFGFDVSRHDDSNTTQKKIDFNKMKSYGASFCISKAGQLNWEDEDFEYNWKETEASGLLRSSYWFGDIRDSGKKQAQKYFDILVDNSYKGEMCFIDYENLSWTNWNELYNFIAEFQRISGLPNEKIGIYTGYYYFIEHSPKPGPSLDWFGKYPLWLASYSTFPAGVRVPSIWKNECLLWQDGTPSIGIEAGVESKEIDHNIFNSKFDLEKFFGKGVMTPPNNPPQDDVIEIFVNGKLRLNIVGKLTEK
jgi:GH25 family lysozyme M1 (1,4-beta-N-acetylmuramidase)